MGREKSIIIVKVSFLAAIRSLVNTVQLMKTKKTVGVCSLSLSSHCLPVHSPGGEIAEDSDTQVKELSSSITTNKIPPHSYSLHLFPHCNVLSSCCCKAVYYQCEVTVNDQLQHDSIGMFKVDQIPRYSGPLAMLLQFLSMLIDM